MMLKEPLQAEPLYYDYLPTRVGLLVFGAGSDGLEQLFFSKENDPVLPPAWQRDPKKLGEAISQMKEYLAGKRRVFDLPLAPQGTPFQLKVWQALREIPYGVTITYKEQAEKAGSPKAFRAVGNANGKNPLVIIQPCHRVVACGGKLGGFSSGLHRKKFLLGLERGENNLF